MPLALRVFLLNQVRGNWPQWREVQPQGSTGLALRPAEAVSGCSSPAAVLSKMNLIFQQYSITSSPFPFRLKDSSSFQKVQSHGGVSSWLHREVGLWTLIFPTRCLLGRAAAFSQALLLNPWCSEALTTVMPDFPVCSRTQPSLPSKAF